MIITGPAVLPAITYGVAAATNSLYLMTYTVSGPRPRALPAYSDFFRTLLTLAERGLDCRLLHPSSAPEKTGAHQIDTINQLTRAGWKVRTSAGLHTMHAKLFLIDSKTAFVGSANLSANGLSSNIEIVTHHTDRLDAAALRTFFLSHWNRAICLL